MGILQIYPRQLGVLGGGFSLLTFTSAYGQTYFISLFSQAQIKAAGPV